MQSLFFEFRVQGLGFRVERFASFSVEGRAWSSGLSGLGPSTFLSAAKTQSLQPKAVRSQGNPRRLKAIGLKLHS